MKYGQREIIDLTIYDELGNKVAHLDSLKESYLGKHTVFVKDALLDLDLLKFMGKAEDKFVSDYESESSREKYDTTIVFNHNTTKPCKLIGKGVIRSQETGRDVEFMYEVPKAEISLNYTMIVESSPNVSDHDFSFDILPFNEEGDMYKLHI
ncbi:hypothetical protein [Paenibacillus sp. Mc5Re-14]|uniref:hypothetical protein n=1 Tax=Paenibacillus sp. Mc5Re-14 TaxID=1030529 RepID=UPI000AE6EA2D|nr:hypothetical protein [Paenibacillus sp. Mc5Re-14]